MSFRGFGWYLSATATLLYCSWFIHNIVAWMKIRPFFMDTGSLFSRKTGVWTRNIYMGTLVLTIGPIILQIYDNFRFFNGLSDFYKGVRPYEPLFRDPWWVFTCFVLFHVVSKCYGTGVLELVKRSPRFGILLAAIFLSLTFTTLDIISSIHNFLGSTDGINPWWKLSLVFKCLTDTIMLDDFKTELKRLGIKRIKKEEMRRNSMALVIEDKDTDENGQLEFADALNVSPERLAAERRNGAARGRMRNTSFANGATESSETSPSDRDHQKYGREQTGRGGRKLSHLPSLPSGVKSTWTSIIPTKKIAKNHVPDLEKDPSDVVRSNSRQEPRQQDRNWFGDEFDDELSDESDSGGEGSSDAPQRRKSRPPPQRIGKLDRLTGEKTSKSEENPSNGATLGEMLREDTETHGSNAPQTGGAAGGGITSFDDMDFDFQTKPAGL